MKKQNAEVDKKDVQFIFSSIEEFLPKKYITEISTRIEKPISSRQIRFILNGERSDNFNVINIAIEIALEEKAKRELVKERLSMLKK